MHLLNLKTVFNFIGLKVNVKLMFRGSVTHFFLCGCVRVCVCVWACVLAQFPGVCDDCRVWTGVLHQDLGSRLLLQISRMAGKAEICQEALLCHRFVPSPTYTQNCKVRSHNNPFLRFLPAGLNGRPDSVCGVTGGDSSGDSG